MKKFMKRLLALSLACLTGFQTIDAQSTSQISIQVVGDGVVSLEDSARSYEVKEGETFQQSYLKEETIAIRATANEDSVVSDVRLDGQVPSDFQVGQTWQTTYSVQQQDAHFVITFSKEKKSEEKTEESTETNIVGSKAERSGAMKRARSGSIRVNDAKEVLWYNPQMPNYGINAAYYSLSNGYRAFCGEGMNAGVLIGQSLADPVEIDNANLRKALYYGYSGPGDLLTSRYGEQGAIALTSELVSYANCGTSSSSATPEHYQWILSNVGGLIFSQTDPVDVYQVYRCANSEIGTNWQNQTTKRQDVVYGIYSPYGKVKIDKTSLLPLLSNKNAQYASMEGAQYGLYSDAQATKLVGTLTIGADGSSNTLDQIKAGRYYLKEIKQPSGYALDTTIVAIDVKANQTTTQTVQDIPQSNPIRIVLKKVDADTKKAKAQGSASLEGAEFKVTYRDQKEGDPLRTWVLRSDAQGQVELSESYKVSGDAFYTNSSGQVVLPLGYVTIQETKAPTGYKLNKETIEKKITSDSSIETVQSYQIPIVEEEVKTGEFGLAKFISDANQSEVVEAEVGAEFVAVLDRYYQEADQDIEKALELAKKEGTKKEWSVLKTDKNGEARSGKLAYGTYIVKQTKVGDNAKESYELKEAFQFIVGDTIYGQLEDGRRIEVSSDGLVHFYINDVPFTSGLKIVKKDAESGKTISLSGASFQIQKLDKEGKPDANYSRKMIRTDAKGIVSMKVGSRWVDTFVTNAENQLSVSNAYMDPSEEEGTVTLPVALPSGDYQLKEVQAPQGYLLAEDGRFTITKSAISGTDPDGQPVLTMTALDDRPKGKLVFTKTFEDGVIRHGQVQFELRANEDIVDPADGSILYKKDQVIGTYDLDENDQIVLEDLPLGIGKSSFTWKEISTYENAQLDTKERTVEFEQKDETSQVLEKKMTMKNRVLKIATKALNAQTNQKDFGSQKRITVTDVVSYQGLEKGKTYYLHARLMEKESGQAVQQEDGSVVETTFEFTPKQSEGTVSVPLHLDSSSLGGKDFVVYETLLGSGEHASCVLAKHEDLSDEDQTISILPSKIQTQASSENGTQYQQVQKGKIIWKDTVSYEGLVVGQTYKLKGELMDKETGQAFKDLQATTTFTPKKSSGHADVLFTLDGEDLSAGQSIVVFETLYEVQKEEDIEVCSHKDLTDEKQCLSVIDLKTMANSENGSQEQQVGQKKGTITDHVSLKGLEAGKEYSLQAVLMHKQEKKAVSHASITFQAESEDCVVEVPLDVDLSQLSAGEDLVVFESLFFEEKEIAKHQDYEDEDQTIHLIDLKTEVESEKNSSLVVASQKVSFVDHVHYENLEVGKEYTVKGILMDPESGEAFLVDGQEVHAQTTFTAKEANGVVDLTYHLDASTLEGKQAVVFEDLYREDILIASHADLKDQKQTVDFRPFQVKVRKVDAANQQEIIGKPFAFTLFENQTCTKKVETKTSDGQSGAVTFSLREGKYYLKETQAPSGYRLSDRVVSIEVKEGKLLVDGKQAETDEVYMHTLDIENTSVPSSRTSSTRTGSKTNRSKMLGLLGISMFLLIVLGWKRKKSMK